MVACVALAAPAVAGPLPAAVPDTTSTSTSGPPLGPTTTAVTAGPTTTVAPTTVTTNAGAVATTTSSSSAPGPTTTMVDPKLLAGLLKSLNADLARMSAVQSFIQAKAAAAAVTPTAAAIPIVGPLPPAPDPELVRAAAAELAAGDARGAAELAVATSTHRLHEMAVAFYVHADAATKGASADAGQATAPDRSVILGLLLRQERGEFDTAGRQLIATTKTQVTAKAHASQLVAARAAAIEAAARRAAIAATTTMPATTTTAPALAAASVRPGAGSSPASKYATSGLSVLGPPALSATELAAWFASTGRTANITVPLATLAALYQTNGAVYGVRDDIAFTQSIIETGYFGFPSGGQVRPTDNNFAGIGACDTCSSGRSFPDASTGVAAQLQLLHNYASPVAALGPLGLTVGPTGCCPTWMALTGVWATASNYGYAILTLYKHIVEWVLPRRLSGAGL
ncbi:MAG TPA: glucosaminidase domain-containing protein [Acidimicrobiales bacterium]|nr:glucosaminidase domain-containing protein [Acidimicrobiales bacterium]